jgi:hypothetical protein
MDITNTSLNAAKILPDSNKQLCCSLNYDFTNLLSK